MKKYALILLTLLSTSVMAFSEEEMYENGDPESGNHLATVTLVEFFDYNCRYCKYASPALEQLVKEDKDVRIIYKHLPILGETSRQSYQMAMSIFFGQPGKYEAVHKGFMNHPSKLTSMEEIRQIVEASGADFYQAVNQTNDLRIMSMYMTNRKLADELDIKGVPALVVNGKYVGSVPSDIKALRNIVAEARK